MFTYLASGVLLICFTVRYFTPPTNFDDQPSKDVEEWIKKGEASRKMAELLVWHGVYYKNPGSPAAAQLINGGGWTWATAELRILGYQANGNDWKDPVRI